MRIGVCANYDRWGIVASVGYDYVEGDFSNIACARDEDFEKMKKACSSSGINMEASKCFFPGDFVLYSKDNFDEVKKNVREYCERGFARSVELGHKVAAIGSAGARNIKEDYTKEEAEEQFCEILRICGEVGAKYGITVTVEPLNPKETNFINTFADGMDIVKKTAHPNVLAMVDFYHHVVNGEPLETLDGTEGILVHVHIARANRETPTLDDAEVIIPKIEYLKKVGYNGRISIESIYKPDFETAIKNAYPLLSKFR
ncbi:MAG: sugar phosphate isomerase/epimerase [Clostridia bacterium]|nr:sugar phosphate isomerase/epimerase [Clostridia bacterium]